MASFPDWTTELRWRAVQGFARLSKASMGVAARGVGPVPTAHLDRAVEAPSQGTSGRTACRGLVGLRLRD